MVKPSLFHKGILSTITARLMIAFISIVLPLQVTAYLMFAWSNQRLQSGIEQETISNATFLSNKIDTELNYLLNTTSSLINDNSVKRLFYYYDNLLPADLYISLNELQKKIALLDNNNLLLEKLYIHFSNTQQTLTAEDYYHEDSDAIYKLIQPMIGKEAIHSIIDQTLNFVELYPGSSRFSGANPQYLVRAAVSSDTLSKYLSDFSVIRQKNIAIVQKDSGFRVYGHANQLGDETFEQLLGKLSMDTNFQSYNTATVELNSGTYYTVTHYLPLIDSLLVQAVPVTEIYAQQFVYRSYINYFILLSVLLFIVYALLTRRLVNAPVYKLLYGFKEIERGNYNITIDLPRPANEFEILISRFNRMTYQLNVAVNKLYLQELYVKQIELKQLQTQINPHFLYNSFFMLSRLIIQEDLESAKRLSDHLGHFFKYITRNDQDNIPLFKEWEHTKSYTDIQTFRYTQRITFDIEEVPLAYKAYLVPRLILQPVVENALEHGFKNKSAYGFLRLYFEEHPTYLSIIVEDNGDDISPEQVEEMQQRLVEQSDVQQDTTALVNIHRRLRLFYGMESGVYLNLRQEGGLRVELRLPSITRRDE